jgi:hypothetical protein
MSTRSYGKLFLSSCTDTDYEALGVDGQWVYQTLLRQPNMDTCGVLPLQMAKWARGARGVDGMTDDRIGAAVRMLIDRRYIIVDFQTEEVLVRTFVKWDVVSWGNPKVMTGALNSALRVQSHTLRAVLLSEFRKLEVRFTEHQLSLVDALETSVVGSEKNGQRQLLNVQCSTKSIDSQSKANRKPFESLSAEQTYGECVKCRQADSVGSQAQPGENEMWCWNCNYQFAEPQRRAATERKLGLS